jgi:uncharacterized protein involved in exopolysaccharide biosynthesis
MPAGNHLDFEAVCRYVGRLYLESQHEIERLNAAADNPVVAALRERLKAAERRVAELEAELARLRGDA